jgi:hypothetical protein
VEVSTVSTLGLEDDGAIDLARFDDEYSRLQAAVPEGGRREVPDGQYEVRVEEARLARTPRTGNPMIIWKLRILGPTHCGDTLTRTRIITSKTLGYVKRDLETFGIHLDRFSDLEQALAGMENFKLAVFKKRTENGWDDVYFLRAKAAAAAPDGSAFVAEEVPDDLPF